MPAGARGRNKKDRSNQAPQRRHRGGGGSWAVVAWAALVVVAGWRRVYLWPAGRRRTCGRRRPEHPAHHHRHAARRRPRLVRRAGRHARARPARRRGRALRLRARARGDDAAVAREHPDGPVPVPARRAREQRIPAAPRREDRRHAAQAGRLRDGGVRGRLPGAFPVRPERRVRRLRRPLRRRVAHRAFAMPERPASAVVALARQWIGGRWAGGAGRRDAKPWFVWVHVFDPHAPYRPPAPFDARYAAQPYYGEVAAVDAALAPLLDDVRNSARPTLVIVTGDHGEGLGDHGEEAHGIFAYESTLRIPLIVAELGGAAGIFRPTAGGRAARARSPRRRSPRRHPADDPRRRRAAGAARSAGRTLLPARAACRGGRRGRCTSRRCPGCSTTGGRRSPASCRAATSSSTCPSSSATTSRPTRRSGRTSPDGRPSATACSTAMLAAFRPVLPGQRVAEDAEAAASLRALGYVSGNAPRKAGTGEDDDPKRLVELDSAVHRALDAFGEGRADEAAKDLPSGHRAPPEHGHRVSPPGVHRMAAGKCGWRHRCARQAVAPASPTRGCSSNSASISPRRARLQRASDSSSRLPADRTPRSMR